MNPKELIEALKEIHRICCTHECCNTCVLYNPHYGDECGLTIIPCNWNLNEPSDWKAFKE